VRDFSGVEAHKTLELHPAVRWRCGSPKPKQPHSYFQTRGPARRHSRRGSSAS